MTENVLITGGGGKLGREIKKIMPLALTPTHSELDITDRLAVFNYLGSHKIDTVIHTAAIANIQKCETDKELAWKTNVIGTENLVDACQKHAPRCYFVYISTACVFLGDRGNYTEDDIPNPKNFYALTKLLGEFVVKKLPNSLIIRTNFIGGEKWPYKGAFVDRFGTYLFADDLAYAIKDVMSKGLKGLVHIAGQESMSMFDVAKLTTPDVLPIKMDDIGLPLTKNMTLRSIRIAPYKMTKSPKNTT